MIDRSEQRRHLAELAAREADQLSAARAALATDGPTRLSAIETLETDAFRLFLGLLGDALATLTPGRRDVSTTSSDGSMAIRLTALTGAGDVVVTTPDGEFHGPDHLVHIEDLVDGPTLRGTQRMTAPSLSDALSETRRSEVVRAARALLRRPVLRAHGADAEDVVLVRRHAGTLREWFERNTGWRLIVESEVARLVKTVADVDDPTHPARDPRSRAPFSRRRYVLVCLALGVLERAEPQITLGRLAEQVLLAVADPDLVEAGIVLTLERRDERTDLVAVVRMLIELGALARVAGDEDAFVRSEGDALYDVDRRVLSSLLVAPRGPSTIDAGGFEERLADLVAELPPTTDELRNRQIRRRLTRRLLEDPVLYLADLDDDERAYLASQRHAITGRIAELTGLVPEVRAEGIAMVDPSDDLTDVRMPEIGTEGHVTLLIAQHLGSTGGPVSVTDLHAHVRGLAGEHASNWRRSAAAAGAEVELTEQALLRLTALRLARVTDDLVHPLPALHRYAVGSPTIQDPRSTR